MSISRCGDASRPGHTEAVMSDNPEVAVLQTQFSGSAAGAVAQKTMKDRGLASVPPQVETGGTSKRGVRPPKRRVRAGGDTDTSARKPAADELSEPPNQEEEAHTRDVAVVFPAYQHSGSPQESRGTCPNP
jgi:hypothetical protein